MRRDQKKKRILIVYVFTLHFFLTIPFTNRSAVNPQVHTQYDPPSIMAINCLTFLVSLPTERYPLELHAVLTKETFFHDVGLVSGATFIFQNGSSSWKLYFERAKSTWSSLGK
jgi:hypothetical protein